MYRSFEEATVRFDSAKHKNSREVLELLNPLSDSEKHHLLRKSNVYDLKMPERVKLMHLMLLTRYDAWKEAYDKEMIAYNETLAQLRRLDLEKQIGVLSKMKVVGMTISGAAIYRETIAALKPKHVLVEEAGEVLEPLLIAALGPWVTRLTLVGDHQQLPPSVENHELAKNYAFNTSLMERLVKNELKHVTLTTQTRMMPEMAELLLDVYPTYQTSELVDVKARCSPPPGALRSIWWWDVRRPPDGGERIDPEARSYVNDDEATAVIALVRHLVNSGVEPAGVTILASYSAQIELIEKRVSEEIGEVLATGWPTVPKEGIAAQNLLETLGKQIPTSTSSSSVHEAQLAQCIQVSETLLKLGNLAKAKKALGLAKRLQGNATAMATVQENWTRVEKLEALKEKVDHICGCTDVDNARSLFDDAINVLKQLEGLAVRWRSVGSSGVPAAAACCVLVQDWADAILKAGHEWSEGRRQLLRKTGMSSEMHLKELRALNGVTFSSIDRYQGSENDVVIISLVRSNTDCKVGFLTEPARRVVAQSRARLGMYFVGDGETFAKSKEWLQLTTNLDARALRGPGIPLCCPAHPRCIKEIQWQDAASCVKCGICQEPCGQLMSCGVHKCKRLCHGRGGGGIDQQHLICTEEMPDVCCAPERHDITRKCYQQAADVACGACKKLANERKEKEKREAAEREKRAQAELETQIEELKRQPPGLVKRELAREGADLAEYLRIVDRTEKYIQVDHHCPIHVLRIERLFHPRLEELYHKAKGQLHKPLWECNEQHLFHGTSTEGVAGITENGFRLPAWSENNMFGQGVYFATDSTKSANELYTKGSNCLLLCDVLLGHTCTIDGLKSEHPLKKCVRSTKHTNPSRPYLDVNLDRVHSAGFDSIFAPRGGSMHTGGVKYDEYIVYNPEQALPRYIIHFGKYGLDVAKTLMPKNMSGGVVRYDLFPKREFDPNDEMQMHFRIAESQFLRTQHLSSVSNPIKFEHKLIKVEFVVNPRLIKAFEDQEAEFKLKGVPHKTVLAFHGTKSRAAAEAIVENNFDRDRIGSATDAGWYGKGHYFSEFVDTSMSYGGGTNMLLCRLLPGKEYDTERRMDGQPIKDGYNSHRVAKNADGCANELVIDNSKQILPCYILHVGTLEKGRPS